MRVEIRSDAVLLDGYVNAVGRDSRILTDRTGKKFVEQIVPGTFQRALEKGNNVEIDLNHNRVLGSRETGEVELYEDAIGLRAKALISDPEVRSLARNNRLTGWSFEFIPKDQTIEPTDNPEIERRYLKDIYLKAVSILSVTPAYIATSIEARSENAEAYEVRALETDVEVTEIRNNDVEISYDLYEKQIELLKLGGKA
jgi:HK97 family phage prohead protease